MHIIQSIIYTYHIHNQSKTYIKQAYNLSYTYTKLAYSRAYHTTNHICISHTQSVKYPVSIQSCISYNQSYIHITCTISQIHISHRHTIYHIPSKHTVMHIIQPIIYAYHIHNQSNTYITQAYKLSYTYTKLAYSHAYHTVNHIYISHT